MGVVEYAIKNYLNLICLSIVLSINQFQRTMKMKDHKKIEKHYKKNNTNKLYAERNETPAQKEARIQHGQYQSECCCGKISRAKLGTRRKKIGFMFGQV